MIAGTMVISDTMVESGTTVCGGGVETGGAGVAGGASSAGAGGKQPAFMAFFKTIKQEVEVCDFFVFCVCGGLRRWN